MEDEDDSERDIPTSENIEILDKNKEVSSNNGTSPPGIQDLQIKESKINAIPIETEPTSHANTNSNNSVPATKTLISKVDINDNDPSTYRIKIADFGNACWVDEHFTNDIQTRQYRAPEVILGLKYDTSCDMWSMGSS